MAADPVRPGPLQGSHAACDPLDRPCEPVPHGRGIRAGGRVMSNTTITRDRYCVSPQGRVFELRRPYPGRYEMWREFNGRPIQCRVLRGCKTLEHAIESLLADGYERHVDQP